MGSQASYWRPACRAAVRVMVVIVYLSVHTVYGAPTMGPDMYTCKKHAMVPPHNTRANCCLPLPTRPIKDFRFEDQTLSFRVRRPAHKMDTASIEKYNKAYELMRALPHDDPRSFHQQANVHCAYCGFGFKQLGINVTLEIHGTWISFPFHRWYIYFHERILASLINDTSFALPFWNWDSMIEPERPAQIPSIFFSQPALFDALRNPKNRNPAVPDLSTDLTGYSSMENKTLQELIDSNNNLMYSTVVSGATLPSLFLGQPLRGGIEKVGHFASAFELGPHAAIHGWVGDPRQPNGEDMIHLYSAGRDPIFYTHHANCDRLWNVWKTIPGGKRVGFEDDPDWLESQLLFYDENADLVRVKVKDALDTEKLMYAYEEVENPWVHYKPASSKKIVKTEQKSPSSVSTLGIGTVVGWLSPGSELLSTLKERFSGTRDAECGGQSKNVTISNSAYHMYIPHEDTKTKSARRRLSTNTEVLEEVLIFTNIQVPSGKKISFDIFMDINADDKTTLAGAEYVATYTNMPLRSDPEEQKSAKVTFPVAIGSKLKILNLENEACVPISVVPKIADNADAPVILIEQVHIETVLA